MDELPMPSEVKRRSTGLTLQPPGAGPIPDAPLLEPPSAKLIVRLFLIPFLIVAAAVGVMFLIGRMAGGDPTLDEALARLKHPGGERTADLLVGPASKQRYIDAKTVVDKMKAGMSPRERVTLSNDLIEIINHFTRSDEGEVRHFMLLALGRAWQKDSTPGVIDDPSGLAARQRAMTELLKYADDPHVMTRKAAILATVYWAGREEVKQIIPKLIQTLRDEREDVDVRMAAATALGPIASPSDEAALDALRFAMRDTEPRNAELVWDAALSLAQLNQPDAADTVLGLLDRDQLAKVHYYDRESDPKNPAFRSLGDAEIQRFLINAMIGASRLEVPAVQERIRKITQTDPSLRVREAGQQVIREKR